MIRDVISIEASDHREKVLECMADTEHGPFYTPGELREAVGINSKDFGDRTYFNELLHLMANQGDITTGGAVAVDKYVLPHRAREFTKQHGGQIL